MKILLNFTPKLVLATIFFALLSPSLMANTNAAALQSKDQSFGQIAAAFIFLLLVIVLPLTRKRNAKQVK